MRVTNRRDVLAGAGALSAAAALGGFPSSARAASPINFIGWTFRPDMVQSYVDFFNKTYGEQVNFSTLPWTRRGGGTSCSTSARRKQTPASRRGSRSPRRSAPISRQNR